MFWINSLWIYLGPREALNPPEAERSILFSAMAAFTWAKAAFASRSFPVICSGV